MVQPKKHKQNTEGSLEGPGRVSTGQRSFLVPGQVSHFWSLFFMCFVPGPGKKRPKVRLFTWPREKSEKLRPKLHQKVDPPPKVRQKHDFSELEDKDYNMLQIQPILAHSPHSAPSHIGRLNPRSLTSVTWSFQNHAELKLDPALGGVTDRSGLLW